MGTIVKFKSVQMKKGDDKMPNIEKSRMLEIEKITTKLLAGVDLDKSPCVDIVSLVKKDGFKVEPNDMDIDTTGCVLVSDDAKNKKRLILVNTMFRNPENEVDVVFKKSRFITAHEYGHFILHKEEGQPIYAHRDTYHRTEPIELEADYFARSILMPLSQFKVYYEILNQMGNNDEKFTVGLLSKIFKVTSNKVRKRVEDLLVLDQ
ncbi:MAG: ImmA/IrrE family metallo-endopeptidase [Lachnospiraceae bacterium]|nr:ImmA/IrrE family metallo-endopeptidase [Lachnospiraceae bacterium]